MDIRSFSLPKDSNRYVALEFERASVISGPFRPRWHKSQFDKVFFCYNHSPGNNIQLNSSSEMIKVRHMSIFKIKDYAYK